MMCTCRSAWGASVLPLIGRTVSQVATCVGFGPADREGYQEAQGGAQAPEPRCMLQILPPLLPVAMALMRARPTCPRACLACCCADSAMAILAAAKMFGALPHLKPCPFVVEEHFAPLISRHVMSRSWLSMWPGGITMLHISCNICPVKLCSWVGC